ncbi:MAG: hypothetical protein JOZ90_11295 [Alphaproteobacteria bacterium]|nr:hypothetical protein [Alphaproteobacteria bacterium]MBV9372218.1 hypothetical protein [Alphaproteobacteria bacterium]MBV9901671.1 hypothetical protein [Alphaproteobacteria bacterium]
MKVLRLAATLALAAAPAAPAALAAQSGAGDILDKVINVPPPSAWRIDGLRDKPALRKDAGVQGGKAVRVEVPGKGAHPWDVAAANPIAKPVKAGDVLVLAFWARLVKGEGGATTALLPSNQVQLAAAPYTPLFSGPATIGSEWKMYEVRARSTATIRRARSTSRSISPPRSRRSTSAQSSSSTSARTAADRLSGFGRRRSKAVAKAWEFSPIVEAAILGLAVLLFKKPRISAIPSIWHGLCNTLGMAPDSPDAGSGSKTMSFNFANAQQFAVSIVGALVAATLFVSAAVGPVGQLI